MKKQVFSLFILFQCFIIAGQTTINEYVSSWANNEVLKHGHVGVAIHDVEQGYMLTGFNYDKSFVPASSLKLLSSLVTLQRLGQDFVYDTQLAYSGSIQDSILYGNVYIVGAGDPSLGSKRFNEKSNFNELISLLTYKIKNIGIKSIQGQIIADHSVFDRQVIGDSWQWNDLGSYYATGAWGLNVHENEYEIWYNCNKSMGELADFLSTFPKINKLNLAHEVVIDAEDTGDNAFIYGGPDVYEKRIKGTIPLSKNPFKIKGSIPHPPRLLAETLSEQLINNGIYNLGSDVIYYIQNNTLFPITNLQSLPLKELVKQANYHSLNMYCEAFLRTLGYKKGSRGNTEEGVRQIELYLQERGFDISGLNIEDGSGLSARNYITPYLLSGFLASFAKENGYSLMTELIPQAGSDGTVRRMLKDSPARGKVWMKSGSMNKIISYSGIMRANNQKWYTFTIMINGYSNKNSEIRKHIENLLEKMYLTL